MRSEADTALEVEWVRRAVGSWLQGREFLVIVEVDADGDLRGEFLVPHSLARELADVLEDIAELISPVPVHRPGQLGFVLLED